MVDYDNSGVLFKNDKRTNELSPEYTGNITVNGEKLRLAAWVKEKDGRKYFSLKISEQTEMKNQSQRKVEFDDEIPF